MEILVVNPNTTASMTDKIRAGAEAPKTMSVGLHARLVGRPGRLAGLARFLDHVAKHDRVWICRRLDIARHWTATHPYRTT